jgi:transposase InsO family protein
MIIDLMDEAVHSGTRLQAAGQVLGLTERTVQRWKKEGLRDDLRRGPHATPANKLSVEEREEVLRMANAPKYRDLSPKQIVPLLADQGCYIASESTFYRVLREEDQINHRQTSRPASCQKPREHVATAACQVWSWDITYLKSSIRGVFYYLYLIVDVWSRKIVAAHVFEIESNEHAARLFARACNDFVIDPSGLILHSDNGGPMKGSTMLATLQRLGVVASFSRPRVSDDNPYSEALFRTLKYRPEYPSQPFASVAEAQSWVDGFVQWYNTEHLHSAIRFVTPDDRHFGRETEILRGRKDVYEKARCLNPNRWSQKTRNWDPVEQVVLNPQKDSSPLQDAP